SIAGAMPFVIAVDVLLALVALGDLVTVPRRRWFECERTVARVASLAKPHAVRVTISSRATRELLVGVRDDIPDECQATPEHFQVRLAAQSRSTVSYELSARRRGAFRLEAVYLRVMSTLGLW